MKNGMRYRVAGRAARLVLDALLGTARFESEGDGYFRDRQRSGHAVIFVLWHGRLLPLTYAHRRQGIAALISRSADGEYLTRVLEGWGYVTVRGSSSRGGTAALREMVRQARTGRSLAITPDGPRGPREKMKPGALLAAQLTGIPLVPVAAGTKRAWWFEGWDRFLVPKPFARIRLAYGPPIFVPRDAGEAALEEIAANVEASVNTLMRRVDEPNGR